jgi:hypothetical protein
VGGSEKLLKLGSLARPVAMVSSASPERYATRATSYTCTHAVQLRVEARSTAFLLELSYTILLVGKGDLLLLEYMHGVHASAHAWNTCIGSCISCLRVYKCSVFRSWILRCGSS